MTNLLMKCGLVIFCFLLAGWVEFENTPSTAQVVTLDECDPATFNAPTAVGPEFCKNVALGASTTFSALLSKAAAGTPDTETDNINPNIRA